MQYGEIFTVSGIFKILEIFTVFVAIMLHRFGDYGFYLFFDSTAVKLYPDDDGINVENLGNGTLVFSIILSSSLLLSYVLDGRYPIQILFLESFWNFLCSAMLMGTGVKTLINWSSYEGSTDHTRNQSSGLAMGALCALASIFYFCDFMFSWATKNRLKRDAY